MSDTAQDHDQPNEELAEDEAPKGLAGVYNARHREELKDKRARRRIGTVFGLLVVGVSIAYIANAFRMPAEYTSDALLGWFRFVGSVTLGGALAYFFRPSTS